MARKTGDIFTLFIVWGVTFIVNFIKGAYKRGRLLELVVSFGTLTGAYYLLFTFGSTYTWVFAIPISVFVLYWIYLFQVEKITSVKANPKWADRNWWWNLDGWEFEEEAAKVFRLNGYRAEVTQKTSDGGVDILMYKDGKKIIAQCKHYSNPVGVSIARELNGLKEDFKADNLILIASSGVTKSCSDFLKNKPYFKIVDLEDIIRMGLRPHSS